MALPAPCLRPDAAGLWSNPHWSHAMRAVLSVVLAAIGAYALSFALDLLFGGVLGTYPSTAFVPVITWAIIASIAYLGALKLAPRPVYVLGPTVCFGLFALLGAVVGHHVQSWIVAALMFAQVLVLPRALRPRAATACSGTGLGDA